MDTFMLKYRYWDRLGETLCIKIAWILPRKLVFWCFMRVAGYSGLSPDQLNYSTMHDYWWHGK